MKLFKKGTIALSLFTSSLLCVTTPLIVACSNNQQESEVEREYIVHFVTNCSTVIPDRVYNTKHKSDFSLPNSTELFKFGYNFAGWHYNEELTRPVNPNNIVIQGETTLYAEWNVGVYKISFETGTSQSIPDMDIEFGQTVSLPTPNPRVIDGKNYQFKRWYHLADNNYYVNDFTLDYPENVTLYAEYDYYVYSSFKLNDDGTYQLNSSKPSLTDISTMSLAYGIFEAEITYSTYKTGQTGFIWNATLAKDTDNPWEKDSQYYLLHMNSQSGAIQLAYNNRGQYTALLTKTVNDLTESVRIKYQEGKTNETPVTFVFNVAFSSNLIVIKLDGEEQIRYSSNNLPVYPGTGVGFRASNSGVLFRNPAIEATHYQISFVNEGGNELMPLRVEKDVKFSESGLALPIPSKLGYEFVRWVDKDGQAFDESKALSENITLYPEYNKIQGGAYVHFVGNNEQSIPDTFVGSGETLGQLPEIEKAGYDLQKWFYLDNEQEVPVTSETVLVPADYQDESKQFTIYAKWEKVDGEETPIDVKAIIGKYTKIEDYDEYVGYEAGRGSVGTFAEIEEGFFSTYIKFATTGGNGLVIGGNFLSDYATNVDTNYMSVGSSYYYWHFNNSNGIYQFVKVTDPTNEASTNPTAKGYDILFQNSIENFVAGSRHQLSLEFYKGLNSRSFKLFVDGQFVEKVVDDGSVAGPVLTGNSIGFRNQSGGCVYYGVNVKEESSLECGEITLNVDGATKTYARAYGWDLCLPTPTKANHAFVGWTTVQDDVETLFYQNTTMSQELNGTTLYAFFIDSSKSMIVLDANGGELENTIIIADANAKLLPLLTNPERNGYAFEYWQISGVRVDEEQTASELVMFLTAKWGPVSDNVLAIDKVNPKMSTTMTTTSDDVYDFYAMSSDAGIATLDGTFKTGSLKGFFKAPADSSASSGDFGIAFRGTNLDTTSSTADYNQYSCYTFRFTQGNGNMTAYDMGTSTGSAKATLFGNASWSSKFSDTPFFGRTHSFEINVTEQGTSIVIKIYVNNVLIFDATRTNAYQGNQIGFRLTGNGKRTATGSFFGIHAVEQ